MAQQFFSVFFLPLVVVMGISYLLGSISFSILFTRFFNNQDIRTMGSGNAGLTNVLRSVGVKAAVFTLIFDFAKGAASVCLGRAVFSFFCLQSGAPAYWAEYGAVLAGLASVLGHIFPAFFHFHGGKGILTTAAILAFYDWRVFLVAISIFILVLVKTKIVSISSILAAASVPVSNFCFTFFCSYRFGLSAYGYLPASFVWITTLLLLLLSFMLIYMHRENIKRLRSGTEKKFQIKH